MKVHKNLSVTEIKILTKQINSIISGHSVNFDLVADRRLQGGGSRVCVTVLSWWAAPRAQWLKISKRLIKVQISWTWRSVDQCGLPQLKYMQ